MKFKTQTLNRLEALRNRIELLNKNAARGVDINREEFINFTGELINRVDDLVDSISLEDDDQLRFVDNIRI